MTIKEHLANESDSFLKECYDELNEYGNHGILEEIANRFFKK